MSIKEERYDIGAEILLGMESNDDLPLPNRFRLAKTMQEYFQDGDYVAELVERKLRWRPKVDYWLHHISDVCQSLRKTHGKYFEYIRKDGGFKGEWKFTSKREYEEKLCMEHADIGTRTENHNDKIDDGNKRWKLNLPLLNEVPQLTAN